MSELNETLGNKLLDFFEWTGIDPIYGSTALALFILLLYKKDIERWDEIEKHDRAIILATAFGAIVFVFISTLKLIGTFK